MRFVKSCGISLVLTALMTGVGCSDEPTPSPSPDPSETPTGETTEPAATTPQSTPTGDLETPTQEPGTPTAEATATDTEGDITETAGAGTATPTDSDGTPTASDGTPTASDETPTTSDNTPTPADESGTPAAHTPTEGDETQTPAGTPDDTPTEPAEVTPGAETPKPTPKPTPIPTPIPKTPFPTPTPTPGPTLMVTVVDYATGDPIAGAQIYLGDDNTGEITDENGQVNLGDPIEGLITVTAFKKDFHMVTVLGTDSHDLRLPMRPAESPGYVAGEVDFAAMGDVPAGALRLGLVTRSIKSSPVNLDFSTLIGGVQPFYLCEVPLYLPANFVGAVRQCDPLTAFEVPGRTGSHGLFGFAGDLPYDTISSLSDPDFYTNLGQVFLDLQDNLDEFGYDVMTHVDFTSGDTHGGLELDFAGQTNATLQVNMGSVPAGIDSDKPPLTFAMADMGALGLLPIGLAGGSAAVDVFHAPLTGELGGLKMRAMAMAARDGVGSDGPYSAVSAKVGKGATSVDLPDYLDLLTLGTPSQGDRDFSFEALEGATVYHTLFRFYQPSPDVQWDVYQVYSSDTDPLDPAVPTSGSSVMTHLPNIEVSPALSDVLWQVTAFDLETGEFEEFVDQSGMGLEMVETVAERLSRHGQNHLFSED